MNESLKSWLRLIRLPNLLTVPGDVLAGFFLAGGASCAGGAGRLGYVLGAALTLYIVGLLLNDVFDRDVDAKERPDRPIPSGAVPVRAAVLVAIAAALSALNLAVGAGGSWRSGPFAAAVLLLIVIVAYDCPLRRRLPVAGLGLMGLCRALDVFLGATAVLDPTAGFTAVPAACAHAALPAAAIFLYVVAFSALARREADVELRAPSLLFALPFFVLILSLFPAVILTVLAAAPASSAPATPGAFFPGLLATFAAAIAALHAFLLWRVYPRYVDPPEVVGRHVQNLLRVQAALVVASGSVPALVLGAVLFLCAPFFARLARLFPAS